MWWNDGETRSAGVPWLHPTIPGCLIISFGCSSRLLFSVLIRWCSVMLRRCASVALHCETVSINACVYAHSTVPSVNLCCTVKLLCETKQAIPCYCEIHTLYQCFLLRCCWMQSCIFLLTRLKEKLLPLCWHLVMCISLMWSKWGLQQREKNVFLLKFFFILKFFSLASTRRLLLFIFCEIFLCTFSQMEYF